MADRPENATTAAENPFAWPWTMRWPAELGGALFGLAPGQLTQPINPGWSFGNLIVNEQNSSAPEVERAVVARESYGRQIGRLVDAMQVVLHELASRHPALQRNEKVQAFEQLAADVEDIKKAAAAQRVARLKRDLESLKKSDPAAWKALLASQR